MVSISGFLNHLFSRLELIHLGQGLKGKLNLLIWTILDSTPRTVRSRSAIIDCKIRYIANVLTRNTIIVVDKIKYIPADPNSFFILSPKFEKEIWRYLKPKKGEVFIDVGTNVGKYALKVAKIVGNEGLVIALEPHPNNWRCCQRASIINKLNNIIAVKAAAWEKDCKLNLFIGDESGHHSTKQDSGFGHIIVEAKALDNIVRELCVKQVNWIKIDVEGAELEVLKGLKKVLKKFAPKVIVEVLNKNLIATLHFMKHCGYTVQNIKSLEGPNYNYFYCEPISIDEKLTQTNKKNNISA